VTPPSARSPCTRRGRGRPIRARFHQRPSGARGAS
jgi:hypothetical protein